MGRPARRVDGTRAKPPESSLHGVFVKSLVLSTQGRPVIGYKCAWGVSGGAAVEPVKEKKKGKRARANGLALGGTVVEVAQSQGTLRERVKGV